ncbi:MAG: 16S rRNA methyltransferase [Spirochaetaceae bacterium]|jgi:16S rRNA (cytosine1407-C5)-methyltransferase|nr:16S rRNA methyltransferase [Spirochaetaceae bacterium]
MPAADFDEFYRALWGERWEQLRAALCREPVREAYSFRLKKPYYLDHASVLAALELPLPHISDAAEGAGKGTGATGAEAPLILDACAAPGGKSLVLASRMGENCRLIANELSANRRRRLTTVLDEHLAPKTRENVAVTGFNAAARARKKAEHGRYDAILLDAPCSSERHVLSSPAYLAKWTPARPAALALRQWSLLSAAFLLLKPGGLLVYVTCSINVAENDGVVRRVLKKYGETITLEACGFGEPTETGRLILPDTDPPGLGPIFAAKVRKRAPIV